MQQMAHLVRRVVRPYVHLTMREILKEVISQYLKSHRRLPLNGAPLLELWRMCVALLASWWKFLRVRNELSNTIILFYFLAAIVPCYLHLLTWKTKGQQRLI